MPLRLTNTLTGRKEEFHPIHPPNVTLYVCGVTVYDDCHIGHARGAVVFDLLRRYLEARYRYRVIHARNITDLDDKIIDRARGQTSDLREMQDADKRGLTPLDLKSRAQAVAEHFTKRFQEDFSRLGLIAPTHEPRATEFIPKMIRFIETLLQKKVAYEAADGVYFSVRMYAESVKDTRCPYGRLSHQNPDQLLAGARVEPGESKRDPLDFALWKKAKPPARHDRPIGAGGPARPGSPQEAGGEEPSWESPWGPGRPGWHIECSTMSTALLGETFDIHGGGQDLLFPHHENEIAQAKGAGLGFAKVWLHNGLLTVNNQKMSKSLENFVTIPQVLERHSPEVLRLFYLSAHYRSPLDFTWTGLEAVARVYNRWIGFLQRVQHDLGQDEPTDVKFLKANDPEGFELADKGCGFFEALDDDINTPNALACLSLLEGMASRRLAERPSGKSHNDADPQLIRFSRKKFLEFGKILGFTFPQEEIPEAIWELIREREEARRQEKFGEADRLRRQITDQGFAVEDTADGTVVRKRV